MSESAKVYEEVVLGDNVIVGDYCIIGLPIGPKKKRTIIGNDAVIRSHTIIYSGNEIGNSFNTGHHTLIRGDNRIGDNVSIGSFSDIAHDIVIGDDVRIHSSAFIPEFTVLKKGCWIGPNTVMTNAKYPKSKDVKESLKGPTIGIGSILGANVTVLPSVEVADNCLIGAGSVVTEDTEPGYVYQGNPAKKLKKKSMILEYGE
jgi:acetyltransferase-like isoleucine patch superfamily enzyme